MMQSRRYPLSSDDLRDLVRATGFGTPAGASSAFGSTKLAGPLVIAIGAFDGLHLGHRELIAAVTRDAHARGASSVVVTFDPDPSELLAGVDSEPRLLSIADRVRLCRLLGIDDVLVLPFDHHLAARTPREFMDVLLCRLGPLAAVHVGENFRFGAAGAGNADTLAALGRELGFDVVSHPLRKDDEGVVSSTRIRSLLGQGRVAQATDLLGRCHYVRGTVMHGRGEGTSFGFPTANLRCDARVCMPAQGVYACVATDGVHAWPAATNVGKPPTFTGENDSYFLEANLLGFEGDLYDQELSMIFVEWLRASRPFSSLEELERVVLGNIDWVRCNIGASCVEVGS